MKMVSSQSSLCQFLTFPHVWCTVYSWRSHRVFFYWIFGCASHQVCNRIIRCFRQSAVNHGLSRGCTPAGPPQCCGDVAGIPPQVLQVHFHNENSLSTGMFSEFFFFWVPSRHCTVFSQEKLHNFCGFLLAFALWHVHVELRSSCLPLVRQLWIMPRFRVFAVVETLITSHPSCSSTFENFQQLTLQVFSGGSWQSPLFRWFQIVSRLQ